MLGLAASLVIADDKLIDAEAAAIVLLSLSSFSTPLSLMRIFSTYKSGYLVTSASSPLQSAIADLHRHYPSMR
jgi:hypothetical protein